MKNLPINNANISHLPTRGEFRLVIPGPHIALMDYQVNQLQEKYNGNCKAVIGKPWKGRTTGKGGQNPHINGHISQIASETGNTFKAVKIACKLQSMDEGYPFDTIAGQRAPWSETRLSTVHANIFIETIHRVAAELGIELIEE